MRIFNRFRYVRENKRRFENERHTLAGETAELQLLHKLEAWIAAAGCEGYWRVWRGVRLTTQAKGTEIDFIVATHDRVFLLELKNWSGQLEIDGDTLIQIKRHGGESVRHGDLMGKMRLRETALRAWVEQTMRTAPPIERGILFHNPRLSMSADVRAYFGNEIASSSEWLQRLPQQRPLVEANRRGFLELLRLRRPARTPLEISPEMRLFHRAMDELGTWDRLDLYGGRQCVGDILDEGTRVEFSAGFRARLSDRRRFNSLDFEAPRSYLWALIPRRPALQVRAQLRDGVALVETLPPDAAMKFHPVGQRKPEWVPLRHVRHIRYGYAVHRRGQRLR